MNKNNLSETTSAPKLAIVLGSGGARGIAHLGVLEALDNAGIVPDLIVGCSAGSICGALYADRMNIKKAEIAGLEMTPFTKNYHLFGLPSILRLFNKGGIFSMNRVHKFLSKNIESKTFEELKIPLAVVAVSLKSGKLKTLSSGPLIEAVCASCSIPGFFQPVHIEDDYYVDGGIVEVLPTSVAKNLGAKVIIGVDVSNSISEPLEESNILRRISNIIIRDRLTSRQCREDLLIELDFKDEAHLLINSKNSLRLYQAGREATEKVLPKIRELIKKSI